MELLSQIGYEEKKPQNFSEENFKVEAL